MERKNSSAQSQARFGLQRHEHFCWSGLRHRFQAYLSTRGMSEMMIATKVMLFARAILSTGSIRYIKWLGFFDTLFLTPFATAAVLISVASMIGYAPF